MGALSTVQTTVFDIAYFLGIPTLQHLLHEAIIVTRIVARVDALEPVQVCRKDLFEDAPSWRGFCHHQAASLRGVGLCVVARFCHVPPTQSTPASANTRRRSPTCLALEPQWREGNPQMKIPSMLPLLSSPLGDVFSSLLDALSHRATMALAPACAMRTPHRA
jgi:hypothetical protein